MRKPIFAAALCLLAPLGTQALEILDVSRAVRLVDPGNGFFTFDQRSSTTGDFSAVAASRANGSDQFSRIVYTPSSIVVDRSSVLPGSPAGFFSRAVDGTTIAESWLRMSFLTDGPSMPTLGSFSAIKSSFAGLSPIAIRMSLQDLTAGTTVFEFDTADFGPVASWTGSLTAAHVYTFDFTIKVDALPFEQLSAGLNLAVTAQPVPELATVALMLAGLVVTAGAARRRAPARGVDVDSVRFDGAHA